MGPGHRTYPVMRTEPELEPEPEPEPEPAPEPAPTAIVGG